MALNQSVEARLADMERRHDRLNLAIEQMAESQKQTNVALEKLISLQERMVTLEARHQDSRELVSKSLDRFEVSINALSERISDVERIIPDDTAQRLSAIEIKLPQLIEMRGWIITGVGAAVLTAGGVIAKLFAGK